MALNTENFILPWFGARSDFGDFGTAASQCFRVFETEASFGNLHALMTDEFARLKTHAKALIDDVAWTGFGVAGKEADDRKLIFLLNFVRRKFFNILAIQHEWDSFNDFAISYAPTN